MNTCPIRFATKSSNNISNHVDLYTHFWAITAPKSFSIKVATAIEMANNKNKTPINQGRNRNNEFLFILFKFYLIENNKQENNRSVLLPVFGDHN